MKSRFSSIFVTRFVACVAASLMAMFAARSAHAQEIPKSNIPPPDKDEKAKYRDGFMPMLALHSGFAHASGTPNDARDIGNPAYLSSSDLMYGTTFAADVMYALTDYLSFGAGVNVDSYQSAHWNEHGVGATFRIDAFPLLALVPRLRNLGLFLETGIGVASLEARVGTYPKSDGTQSYLGGGAFYELTVAQFKTSHLVLSPELKYSHVETMSINTDAASVGLRIAFYLSK